MESVFALRQAGEQVDVRAIAHDLNNLLTAIAGYAQLVLVADGLPPDVRQDVGDIAEASARACELVRRLRAGA
jgi:signal transduction histidine kinase